jgi:CheY-specific phosphatase CheX
MNETASFGETGLTDPRDWEELLLLAAQEVFEMMIGVPLQRSAPGQARKAGEVTAVIGVAGAVNGVFALRCDEKTAIGITCGMLGVDAVKARCDMWDALGEACNMLIGNFKHKMGRIGEASVLSVPTVIHGHDYRIRPLIDGTSLECSMETTDGLLQLRLDYRLA